jgi:hypothetical protein
MQVLRLCKTVQTGPTATHVQSYPTSVLYRQVLYNYPRQDLELYQQAQQLPHVPTDPTVVQTCPTDVQTGPIHGLVTLL